MKLIKYLGSRGARNGRGGLVDIGLYSCPGCGNEVVLPVLFARGKSGCGCLEKAYKRTYYRPKPDARTCLMCGKKFMSRGPHNRRCVPCGNKISNNGQDHHCLPVYKGRDHSVVAECGES